MASDGAKAVAPAGFRSFSLRRNAIWGDGSRATGRMNAGPRGCKVLLKTKYLLAPATYLCVNCVLSQFLIFGVCTVFFNLCSK